MAEQNQILGQIETWDDEQLSDEQLEQVVGGPIVRTDPIGGEPTAE